MGCGLLDLDTSQWFKRLTTIEGGTKSPAQHLVIAALALIFLKVDASTLDAATRKASMKKYFFAAVVVGTAISTSLNSAMLT